MPSYQPRPRRGRRRSPASSSRSRPASLQIPPARPGHGRQERATGSHPLTCIHQHYSYDLRSSRRPAVACRPAGSHQCHSAAGQLPDRQPQPAGEPQERDYEGLAQIELDFVISTVKVSEKNVPVVQTVPLHDPVPAGAVQQAGTDRSHPPLPAGQVLRYRPLHGGHRAAQSGAAVCAASVTSWSPSSLLRLGSGDRYTSGSASYPPCWEKA